MLVVKEIQAHQYFVPVQQTQVLRVALIRTSMSHLCQIFPLTELDLVNRTEKAEQLLFSQGGQ
jgi:hypothetical protein